jgi:hypothetical protein
LREASGQVPCAPRPDGLRLEGLAGGPQSDPHPGRDSLTDAAHNAVLVVGPGTGRMYLATAIGVAGITRHGRRARFYSTVDLVSALDQEKAGGLAGGLARRTGRTGHRWQTAPSDGRQREGVRCGLRPPRLPPREHQPASGFKEAAVDLHISTADRGAIAGHPRASTASAGGQDKVAAGKQRAVNECERPRPALRHAPAPANALAHHLARAGRPSR